MAIEKKIKVIPVEVHQYCECGGEFIPTGFVYTTYPPKYPHECNKCNKRETFEKSYPTIEYCKENK